MKPKRFLCSTMILGLAGVLAIAMQPGCEPMPRGLVKTPLADRVRSNFPPVGVSIEVPSIKESAWGRVSTATCQGELYEKENKTRAEVIFKMHPTYSGRLTETQHRLNLRVLRLSPQQFSSFTSGHHYYNGDFPFGETPAPFSEAVSRREGRDGNRRVWHCLRRDLKLANGDIVVAGAQLFGEVPDPETDLAQLTAILESIQPLP